MAYLDLFILLSRYVFTGFMVVFLYISATFIYDTPYKLSILEKQKTKMQYICIFFFNLGAYALLIAKEEDKMLQIELLRNAIILMLIVTITSWILRLSKRNAEIPIYNMVFFMMNIGMIMLERLNHGEANKQIIWITLSVGIALFIPRMFDFLITPRFKIVYALLGFLLIITPFFLGETRHGANNWIMVGEFGFQPSELVKILLVLYLASSLQTQEDTQVKYQKVIIPTLVAGVYILCLVYQRDLGGALIYFLTTLTLLYVATNNFLIYIIGFGSGAFAAMIGYKIFAHVRVRVEAWQDPWKDISGTGYQIVQGLFAIGTWGWFGSGLTRGYPTKIPIVTSDFIFAAISEEFGNIVAIGVILLFLLLILYGIRIILQVQDEFLILLGMGLINMIGIQVVLIIGGVIKLIPLTGVTLPFISYGGSSMLVSVFIIGLLQYISDYRNEYNEDHSDESAQEY